MDYNILLELATDLGYRLAMSGAETFRVEESVTMVIKSYGIEAEAFVIPNCMTVSIKTADGQPMTRMRRIGHHGNDLDSVERYSNLSRKICALKPDPQEARQWLLDTDASRRQYATPIYLLGNFLGSCGFAIFFGSTVLDSLWAGVCGILVGAIDLVMNRLKANLFFRTIIESFFMSLLAYCLAVWGIAGNADTITIGSLMLLVPGLLFTNAMRDIIYGDTNSGTNRIVQVFLIAAAIALGTAASFNLVSLLWTSPLNVSALNYILPVQLLACAIGCFGFAIFFNIHGPGSLLCVLGGVIAWAVYSLTLHLCGNDIAGYFWAAVAAALYSEIMARIRKYPAISYLVVSIFPLIPGASIYYTMNCIIRSDMDGFATKGMHTIAIAGVIAVGILMVSTVFRLWTVWKRSHTK